MVRHFTPRQITQRLDWLPRLQLASLPTPLDSLDRLSTDLGDSTILVKREDLTGLALGGNKIRKFSLAQAVESGCDVLVHGAAAQSNQSRVTAAAARLGLDAVIIGRADDHAQIQGNLLLTHMFGAEIALYPASEQVDALKSTIERLRQEGRRPFDTSSGAYPFRTVAYVSGFLELWEQFERVGLAPAAIYVPAGIHTFLGMVIASRALGLESLPIIAVDITPRDRTATRLGMVKLAAEVCRLLDFNIDFEPDDFEICSDFVGPDYGFATDEGREAIDLTARYEGLLLNPSYTGKAMAALLSHIREGRWTGADNVIFVHTGGIPALFAYADDLQLQITEN